jgi:hypothetical protein
MIDPRHAVFVIRVAPESSVDNETAIRMLRHALKFLKRDLGLRCLSIDTTQRSS